MTAVRTTDGALVRSNKENSDIPLDKKEAEALARSERAYTMTFVVRPEGVIWTEKDAQAMIGYVGPITSGDDGPGIATGQIVAAANRGRATRCGSHCDSRSRPEWA